MCTPGLRVLQDFAGIAALRASAELSLHQPAQASDDTMVAFRLIESLEREPVFLALFVRVVLSNATMQPIWEGLAQHRWNEVQLAAFDAHLARIDFPTHCQLALRGERNLSAFPLIGSLKKDLWWLPQFLPPSGWLDQPKAVAGRGFDKLIDAVDPARRRFSAVRIDQLAAEFGKRPHEFLRPLSSLASMALEFLPRAPEQCASAQGTVDLARVAVTLERHRLRHGAYPDSLDLLDPEINPHGIPADDISGKPAHYARTPNGGFTLYYEGWNQIDDGGTVVWKDPEHTKVDFKKGDLVWPQAVAP